MRDRLECPRCRGAMHAGYVLDKGHYDVAKVANWVEGAPETGYWFGMSTGLTVKDRAVLPVATFRCERCGYLESYANPAPEQP